MKTKLTFLIAAFLLVSGSIFAKNISVVEAEQVAKNFIFEQTGVNQNNIVLLSETVEKDNLSYYYIFNIKDGGFVIVSAEDRFDAILGYSFKHEFKTQNIPGNIQWWMNTYVEQIDYCITNDVETENSSQWQHYNVSVSDFTPNSQSKTEVLLETALWDQGSGWNQACPEDAAGPGGHVYAGCVATAMSIVMKYWEYPVVGQGDHSYYIYPYGTLSADFGNTNYMWEYMEEDDYNWYVALLMYHAAVSVDMSFSADGSGAYSMDADDAFRNYFLYGNANYAAKYNYTNLQWETLIQGQLNDGYPVYYSGQSDDGGHAFVVDGYRTDDDFLHFNFGWSGSANGFYAHTDAGGFTSSQAIIYNIYPTEDYYPYSESVINFTAELDTNNLDNFNVDLLWDVSSTDGLSGFDIYRGDEVINTSSAFPYNYRDENVMVDDYLYGVRAIYTDGFAQCAVDDVKGLFDVTFKVYDENGSGIHQAQVDFAGETEMTGFGSAYFTNIPFDQNMEYTASYDIYTYTGTIDYLYKDMFVYVTLGPVSIDDNSSNVIIVAYPNPTNGMLYLSGLDVKNTVNVFDMNGRLVYSTQNVQNDNAIDLTNLSTGVYNVNIISGNSNINHQIIIK